MKNTKKIIGLLLVLVMAIGMTIPAFAANDGKIIIDNPQTGEEEYTAYKIFDVVYDKSSANNETYAYTIIGGEGADKSPWFDVVATYAGENKGLSIYEAAGSANTYVVTFDSTFHAADFAERLAKEVRDGNVTDNSKKTFAKVGETREVTGLELGYYLVVGSTGVVCNLTTTNPEVTIHDKNEVPTITKTYKTNDETEDKFVEVGETITFTIDAEIPQVEGYKKYIYKVEDQMTDNMKFNKESLQIYIEGQLVQNPKWDVEENDGALLLSELDNGFSIELNVAYFAKEEEHPLPGEKVKLVYTATVNDKAVDNPVLENEATLTYSKDPNNPDDVVTDPTAEIITLYSA
ncbi:MAG: isopeptide-forming domain-containing fimbrial protein, partial [Clostridia bacterium]|nr:isopeptide-forming domain-containing fimbrial protein [Clostridia bacterium]MBQ7046666.1 isopeptide-forming domain-containing fimbrial protein [Oscillospiraceae bacterium]